MKSDPMLGKRRKDRAWHLIIKYQNWGYDYIVEAKANEMAILEMLHSNASDEQDAATTTLANLDGVVV